MINIKTGIPGEYQNSKDILENGTNISVNDLLVDANNIVSNENPRGEHVAIIKSDFGFSVQNFKVEDYSVSFRAQFLGSDSGVVYTYDIYYYFYDGKNCSREWWYISESIY